MRSEPALIRPYDPTWPTAFAKLAARIKATLGDLAVAIEHIGSTSVPGLAAKPIIDLDVIVAFRADIPEAIRVLATIGYMHQGDLGIASREAFHSPPSEPSHHLYVLVQGANELHRHLAFRDALRADDSLRDRYAALKQTLAAAHRDDRNAYTEAKAAFITAVLANI